MSKTGIEIIAHERQRQIEEEGWNANSDASYSGGELVHAAAAYALCPQCRDPRSDGLPSYWPWSREWWKPGDRKRELAKAGALIAAELDRLIALEGSRE